MRHPLVTVIIPTLHRSKLLLECLKSLRDQTIQIAEVIVVDQSDNEETKVAFSSFDLGEVKKTYVHQKVKSLIKARNNGLDHASNCDFISFLDDDITLNKNYFQVLLTHLNSSSVWYAGGMGTMVGLPNKSEHFEAFFRMPRYGNGRFLPNGAPTFPHHLTTFSEVEFLSGGMSLYRAEIIKKFRYDERLIGYGYGDDVDVTYRISREYKLFFDPTAQVFQQEEVPNRDPSSIHRKQWIQNMYYLLQKNVGATFKSKMFFAWMAIGITLGDIAKFKKSATLGNLQGIYNILKGQLDSVENYTEFKKMI